MQIESTSQPLPSRTRALLCLIVALIAWGTGPLFVKYFSFHYNAWTQNAFRYTMAAVVLLVINGLRGRKQIALSRRQWGKLVLAAIPNLLLQVSYVSALYFVYPAITALVNRSGPIILIALSCLIFQDERRVIRSPYFLVGASLTLAGVITLILGRDPEVLARLRISERDFWIGVGLTLGFALFGSFYTLAIKRAVSEIPPLTLFTHVCWMTAVGLCLPLPFTGGLSDLWRGPLLPLGVMVISSVLLIVVGHTAFYTAMRRIKAVVFASALQIVPIVTCTLSALFFGERLNALQMAAAAVAIAGAWLAALAQFKTAKE